MDKNELKAMLDAEYNITLRGAVIAYIINLLADMQHCLNEEARDNITDIKAVATAAANDVVGNEMFHEVKKAAGCDFLDFVMNATPGTVAKIFKDSASKLN